MAFSILTVTVNDPHLDKRSAEIAFSERALDVVKDELGRGRGNVTSGVILDFGAIVPSPTAEPTSLGLWTFRSHQNQFPSLRFNFIKDSQYFGGPS